METWGLRTIDALTGSHYVGREWLHLQPINAIANPLDQLKEAPP